MFHVEHFGLIVSRGTYIEMYNDNGSQILMIIILKYK